MKTQKKNKGKMVGGFKATAEEIKFIERVKKHHCRSSLTDTIRFLLQQEYKKILSENISDGV